jgi:hypothetical protein
MKDFWAPKLTKPQAEAAAMNFRAAIGEQESFRPNVLEIAEFVLKTQLDCEFEVLDDNAMGDADAFIQYMPAVGRTLFTKRSIVRRLQKDIPDQQPRFTFAHEFGHLVLHQGRAEVGMPDKQMRMSPTNERAAANRRAGYLAIEHSGEAQANWFAAAFLMPEYLVRECFSARDVADRFNVSKQAAAIRWNEIFPAKKTHDFFNDLREIMKRSDTSYTRYIKGTE